MTEISSEKRVEWAVRFHWRENQSIIPAETREQAEAWAAHNTGMADCWAEVLTRTVPDWTVSKSYPNTPATAAQEAQA